MSTESVTPHSLIITRAMAVILRTVTSPGCPFSHGFAINTFAYWMAHPQAAIDDDLVGKLLGLAQGRCESQEEADSLAYISKVGIASFRPGNDFPWPPRN